MGTGENKDMRPFLLDLYCGAGGAAKGYHDAGFSILGIDINPQPRYPYAFIQADALEYLQDLLYVIDDSRDTQVAIHASPPCQHYSKTKFMNPDRIGTHPDLIEPTRELLIKTGLPYVIENTPGAPLINPITLCGAHFNLQTIWEPYGLVGLRRHRLFETNWPLPDPGLHLHKLRSVPVYGHGSGNGKSRLRGKGCAVAQREVMEIDWMRRHELDQAIPPAMTQYVGTYLRKYLDEIQLQATSDKASN